MTWKNQFDALIIDMENHFHDIINLKDDLWKANPFKVFEAEVTRTKCCN